MIVRLKMNNTGKGRPLHTEVKKVKNRVCVHGATCRSYERNKNNGGRTRRLISARLDHDNTSRVQVRARRVLQGMRNVLGKKEYRHYTGKNMRHVQHQAIG